MHTIYFIVPYSIQALGPELIPVSWQSAHRWLSHKPGCGLSLLSTRPTVSFPVKGITSLCWYQIILLGDMTSFSCHDQGRDSEWVSV